MDPNANLQELRALIRVYNDPDVLIEPGEYDRIVDLVEAMDDWLSNGGFAPIDWTKTTPEHWQEVLASTNARAVKEALDTAEERLRTEFMGELSVFLDQRITAEFMMERLVAKMRGER